MIVIKRNQIIVTALVAMVAIAGYLNYTDRQNSLDTVSINGELPDSLTPVDYDYEQFAGINELNGEVPINLSEDTAILSSNEEVKSEDVKVNEISDNTQVVDNKQPGTAVFVSNNLDDSTYFVQAKLEREQSRAKQKDVLTEMINNANIDSKQRAEVANSMLDIQKRIEKETATESMIKAKGFTEVYVRIDDNTVDVVVSKEALSEAEMAQIEDIVVRKTGAPLENIRISPLKN